MATATLGHAAVLLATLDAALMAEAEAPRAAGLAAAVALDRLLAAHRLGWDDVVAPGSRLAKLCGCLGSAYAGEQSAAYHHAVRLIRRRRATWSGQVRLPVTARSAPPAANHSPPSAAMRPPPPAAMRPPPPAAMRPPPSPPAAPRGHWDAATADPIRTAARPPEADWITTVRQLQTWFQMQSQTTWPSGMDDQRLDSVARSLIEGQPIDPQDARWLRDLWWWQELNHTSTAEPIG